MKVKVGNNVYSTIDFPLMIILDEQDRKNIANMSPTATKYACFPASDKRTVGEREKWMDKVDNRKEVGVETEGDERLSDCSAIIEVTKEGQLGLHIPKNEKVDAEHSTQTLLAGGIVQLVGETNLAEIAVKKVLHQGKEPFELPILKYWTSKEVEKNG